MGDATVRTDVADQQSATTPATGRPARTKVLHIVDTLGMGGAETWLMEMLRHFKACGPDAPQMDFVATSGNAGEFDEEAKALGSRIFYIPYTRANVLGFVRDFRRVLRDGRYSAIHDHQDFASGWHYLMGAGLLPAIRVTHVHNPSYQIRENHGVSATRRLVGQFGRRLVARFATHVAGTSRQVVGEYGFDDPLFAALPKFALHCGFDPARFCGDAGQARANLCREFGWPLDAHVVLFAGRMDRSPDVGRPQNHKNSGLAVDIGIECARRDPRIRMLFAGKVSEALPVLERRIADGAAAGRIVFAGVRRDIEQLMLASDVLLFPSRGEGLGMVAVEAQAAGLPVLASTAVPRECVVVPDLVRFEELDAHIDRWVEQVFFLLGQARAYAAANAAVVASPFSISNSANALLSVYRGAQPC